MDIFDILEYDDFDDFFDYVPEPPRERKRRDEPNYLELDDSEFSSRFRLTKETVMHLFSIIKKAISTATDRNKAISPMNRLLLTLRYYATGSFITVVGDFIGLSKASASRIVKEVSEAIAELQPQFIKFPDDIQMLQREFYNIAKFPRLVGAIDCTHIQIKSPGGNNAEDYKDSKGQFSLNVQTVVSARLKIMDIEAHWLGAVQKQKIFNKSSIKKKFLDKKFGNCVIVGDRGYENTSYLLTPLQNPSTPADFLYNQTQISSRNVVERTYCVWKNRFPVLSNKILLHVKNTQPVIVACAVLHNLAIDMKENQFEGEIFDREDSEVIIEESTNVPDISVRNNLINGYFASLWEFNECI